ncbi:MAG: ribose 5-phosphate isomerase B [Desulfuromonadales bacterium]|jgi:ribose 5-phosphate isomerase B|nr:ribose 5-phosphate isomerase B [Desulfuromonadales bacterium]MDH3807348.1 ribose 5-phosphate isomerase B [Desulfuromonadales bacterium]MDH3960550.1 ribose 5-phosphate isomerase B [Desulfuromonadales bacterium]MDH4024040.1 ribose 5-phosphate isomerase B [Desulfuromonadales bacterium]
MIFIGSDHGGLEMKEELVKVLASRHQPVKDCGTTNGESVDYPDFAEKVAGAVSRGEAELGILVCGTGIGMSIVANKFPGVRAALATDEFMAQMAKEHNNANILVLGGRVLSVELATKMVNVWLDTAYEGGRHQLRLDKISQVEAAVRSGEL